MTATCLFALLILLAFTVCASSFIAYREVKKHNEYMKEVMRNERD
jgi:hypothetical protein